MLKIALVFISLLSINLSYAGGVLIGNGGTVIRCSNDSHFSSLDYIMTKNMLGKSITTSHKKTLQASFQRILNLLENKAPALYDSFNEFTILVGNKNPAKKYHWIAPKNGIDIINDEIINLPFSCRNTRGSVEIVQAIVRKNVNDKVVFEYDSDIFSQLEKADPLQLSFLLVHEWLWDISPNLQENRQLNYFFHSTLFDKMSVEQVKAYLEKFEFN
jgi:hypothetical protein